MNSSRANLEGMDLSRPALTPRDQMALLNALDTPVLIGSAASVATC